MLPNNVKQYLNARHPVDQKMATVPLADWPLVAQANDFPYTVGDETKHYWWYRDVLRHLRKRLMFSSQLIILGEVMTVKIKIEKSLDKV